MQPYAGTTDQSAASVQQAISTDQGTVPNIRLLDPNRLSRTFTQLEQRRNFYGFAPTLDVDRYTVDGHTQDYVVAAREIDPDNLVGNQQDWINRHLVYTHGNGFVAAPANTVNAAVDTNGGQGGYPQFQVSDVDTPGPFAPAAAADLLRRARRQARRLRDRRRRTPGGRRRGSTTPTPTQSTYDRPRRGAARPTRSPGWRSSPTTASSGTSCSTPPSATTRGSCTTATR